MDVFVVILTAILEVFWDTWLSEAATASFRILKSRLILFPMRLLASCIVSSRSCPTTIGGWLALGNEYLGNRPSMIGPLLVLGTGSIWPQIFLVTGLIVPWLVLATGLMLIELSSIRYPFGSWLEIVSIAGLKFRSESKRYSINLRIFLRNQKVFGSKILMFKFWTNGFYYD